MICILCNDTIHQSGKVRPNVATFECGHDYHLSCVIAYCKSRYTDSCPQCNTSSNMSLVNLSNDRIQAIESLIEARRNNRENKTKMTSLGFSSWFTSNNTISKMLSSSEPLSTLRLKGYMPEDLIESHFSWSKLCKLYTVESLLDFGCKWEHMRLMDFTPKDFKGLSWHQLYNRLSIRAPQMMQTNITIHDLSSLDFSVQKIKQLEFTWKDLLNINGSVQTLRLLSSNLSDFKTYFDPSPSEWEQAGFTAEQITANKYKTDDFTPVRQKRTITLKKINSLYF